MLLCRFVGAMAVDTRSDGSCGGCRRCRYKHEREQLCKCNLSGLDANTRADSRPDSKRGGSDAILDRGDGKAQCSDAKSDRVDGKAQWSDANSERVDAKVQATNAN